MTKEEEMKTPKPEAKVDDDGEQGGPVDSSDCTTASTHCSDDIEGEKAAAQSVEPDKASDSDDWCDNEDEIMFADLQGREI